MYSILDHDLPSSPAPLGTHSQAIANILKLRQRVLESGEHLYCSVLVRALIEDEIPRLITLATTPR